MKRQLIMYLLCVIVLLSILPINAVGDAKDAKSDLSEHVFTNEELAGGPLSDSSNNAISANTFIPIDKIEGSETRATAAYYIAEFDDGYLLTSPTSGTFSKTRYSAGNSNSHSQQKWIFVEDLDGYYTVISNTDTTKCLTVNPSTLSVTLSANTGSQYQKWKMYYASGGNALQCMATDSRVNGYKLVIGWTSCSVSATTYTPVGFLAVTWYVPCTSIIGRDLGVTPGTTVNSYTPIFAPANSTGNSDAWLDFASSNTSVCTVNSSGGVTGKSLGTATITITHKITRVSGSFTARVMNTVTHNARILYDTTTYYSASQMSSYYNSATNDLFKTFCIKFNLASTTQTPLLNGLSCPNTNDDQICTSSCGAVTSCASLHHKGASRLNGISQSSSYYTFRLVSHPVCVYDSTHRLVIGVGNVNGKNAITSMKSSPDLDTSIQQELTHNLGARNSTCISTQNCVLNGDFGYWCDNCRAAILASRN